MATIELKYSYVSVLRCATWHVWPEQTRVLSNNIKVPINEKAGLFLFGSIHLVSYEKRPRVKTYSSKEIQEKNSPILWRGRIKSRYLVGSSVVQTPDDRTAYKLHYERAYKGEIDIQFHFATDCELPQEELKQIVWSVSFQL